jgi:ATP-binding cassette subfamily B multidrug efflux pump
VVLNHGRVAELGTHDELMAIDSGLYQRLYLLQQLQDDDEPEPEPEPAPA